MIDKKSLTELLLLSLAEIRRATPEIIELSHKRPDNSFINAYIDYWSYHKLVKDSLPVGEQVPEGYVFKRLSEDFYKAGESFIKDESWSQITYNRMMKRKLK